MAVLGKENNVAFYIAAAIFPFDLAIPSGEQIPIEERSAAEVTHIQGVRIAPADVAAAHPAFDVTPSRYIAAIFTERGVAKAPYTESLARLAGAVPVEAAGLRADLLLRIDSFSSPLNSRLRFHLR